MFDLFFMDVFLLELQKKKKKGIRCYISLLPNFSSTHLNLLEHWWYIRGFSAFWIVWGQLDGILFVSAVPDFLLNVGKKTCKCLLNRGLNGTGERQHFGLLFIYLFVCFCFLGPSLQHVEWHIQTQARDQIGAVAASLHYYSHSYTRSKPSLQPTPQLMAML